MAGVAKAPGLVPVVGLFIIIGHMGMIESASVLLFPYGHGFTSRLLDMKNIAQLLLDDGHDITFLVNNDDRKHLGSVQHAHFFEFPSPKERVTLINDDQFKSKLLNAGNGTQTTRDTLRILLKRHLQLCESLLQQKDVLREVNEAQFDLLIVDFADSCGRILTQYLNVPTMVYSSTGLHIDQALFPNLPSFVPMPMTGLPDTMNFWKRTQNTIIMLVLDFLLTPYFLGAFENLQQEYGLENSKVHFSSVYSDKLIVAHSDFAYDYPRPLLPNVILVGGMHVKPAEPLEDGLEEFMQGSGSSGVIIVSFGSLISNIDEEKANVIASVLSKFSQRVIWRYSGKAPDRLGANTKLLPWLPQNDLLAHPKTRLFVTHCGIHGTHEAIHHAVPVVAVPLMFDQHENAAKLVNRARSGVYVDFTKLSEEALEGAIRETLDNPTYRENARETSILVKDHPVSAKKLFLFYANYLIRHKGTGRLFSEQIKDLNVMQLYSIDVFVFLFSLLFTVICCVCCVIRYACRRFCCSRATGRIEFVEVSPRSKVKSN